jgi:hypothetical protein
MSTEPTAPRLGDENERCLNCGAGLAPDQRYCLNCGERRAEARVPFMEILGSERATRTREERDLVAAPPAVVGTQLPTPVAIGIGVGVVILLLGFGTVLGSLLSGSGQQPVVVGQAGTGGPSAAAANELAANKTGPFKDDWPEGKEGYTVQIQALKKDGTNPEGVAKAKTDTEAKGAAKVGALDSDNYKSLDPGNYVIYSGVYESKKEADGQLEQVNKKFPDARVIKVSSKEKSGGADKGAEGGSGDALKAEGKEKVSDAELLAGKEKAVVSRDQLDNIEKAAGNSKQSAKLPKVIGIEGAPPPKDNKAPGAGSDATTIK